MNKLQELEGKVTGLKDLVKSSRRKCKCIQKELDKAETELISVKEDLRKAEEDLENYKNTEILSTEDEDLRAQDIENFRKRLPAAMAKVDAQDAARAGKESQQELDNFKHKIQIGIVRSERQKTNGDAERTEESVE